MSTIFTKIINREIPSQFVYEDDVCVVVMDKFPAISGQTLVIPKVEVDYAFDLDDETYAHIFAVAKKITKASDKAFSTFRTCLVVEGFEVPHVHIKLYPMTEKQSLGAAISGTPEPADDAVLAEQAEQIKTAL
ncbi:MAG: HIT family protein [Candidatus Kaiserbacteria bacterium]|nr:HIT family protein [Candidatus Kaiserbacteria bacterium]MCB9816601.1 HIT family protein [Candidatus Nomurabacteria bacterium]